MQTTSLHQSCFPSMGRLGTYVDRQIALDKAINYLGTASIHFRHLAFPECPLDRANVDRIKALMQYGRACLPEKSSHQICAIVDRTQLNQALLRAGVLENQLLNYSGEYVDVDFPDNYKLQCLQGKHRVAAAAEILPFSSRRWIVKLFSSGKPIPRSNKDCTLSTTNVSFSILSSRNSG